MKKLLALLLALTMLFSFAACGGSDDDKDFDSVEDQAEDFIDRFENLADKLIDAIEDEDEDKIEKYEKKIDNLEDEYEEILEKLEDEDENLAEKFEEDIQKITDRLEDAYMGQNNNLGNATASLPSSSDNTNNSTNNNTNNNNSGNLSETSAMQKYINSIQSQLNDALETYEQMGMSIKVEARGNALAYVYRFTQTVTDVATARQQLETSISQQASTFQNVLTALKTEVPSASAVIVEYQNTDGSIIYKKEFN